MRELGDEQEQAAHTLGASGWQAFWRITLPSIRWAVVYGVVLTTARCLGEYGAVAVVSGHIEGKTETATLRVQDYYENFNQAGSYGIAIVLAAISVLVLLAMTLLRPKEERLMSIEVRNVSKRFGSFQALDDVSLDVDERLADRAPRPVRLGEVHPAPHHRRARAPRQRRDQARRRRRDGRSRRRSAASASCSSTTPRSST